MPPGGANLAKNLVSDLFLPEFEREAYVLNHSFCDDLL
jgi:hypothetical protein